MMPILLSFDPEFTFLFPPGEIDLLAKFTSDKRAAVLTETSLQILVSQLSHN